MSQAPAGEPSRGPSREADGADLPPAGSRDDARKALLTVLAVAVPLALWHQVLYRRGGAYLLLDLAGSGRLLLGLHAGAALGGAVLSLRARAMPPWRASWLLLAFSVGCAVALIGAFLAFADARAFLILATTTAVALGLLGGMLGVSTWRTLSALSFRREALLDLLRLESLAVGLASALVYLLAAERLGPLRLGLLLSLVGVVVAHFSLGLLSPWAPSARRGQRVARWASGALTLAQLAVEPLSPLREASQVPDPVVLSRNTPTARLLLTSGRGAFQLYVDSALRLSTIDDPRRREACAHPAMTAAPRRRRVLVLGGGDGGVVRELLRYPDVEQIQVVEPEEGLLAWASTQPVLRANSDGALTSPRVQARRADPVAFLDEPHEPYDVLVVNLVDPDVPRRSKWYTRHFYRRLGALLAPDGVGVVATEVSPLAQRTAFWSIVATLEAAGFATRPYRAQLPSLGPWGYVLFGPTTPAAPDPARLPPGLSFLDPPTLASLFALAPDEQRVDADVNLLHHQVLSRYRLP